MAQCSHLAPNGEKSLLYQQLEQKYGESQAHDIWEMIRSQQFLNKHGDWFKSSIPAVAQQILNFRNKDDFDNAYSQEIEDYLMPELPEDSMGADDFTLAQLKEMVRRRLGTDAGTIPVDVNGEPTMAWIESVASITPVESTESNTEPEEIVVDLETNLPKNKLTESEMSSRIEVLYDHARTAPDKTFKIPYEHEGDKVRIGKTQYTSRELANLFDSFPIPDNIVFTPSMRALIDNSSKRILEQYADQLPPELITRNEDVIATTAIGMLLPKFDADGNRAGFFTPAQQKEIVDSIVSYTERLYRRDPAMKANALIKALGLFQAKEQQLLNKGDQDGALNFRSVHQNRVRLAEEALAQLSAMGLHTDNATNYRILEAVEQLRPLTEQEKGEFRDTNPDIDPDTVDIFSGEFLESVGRIARDWSDNTFELDPKDTASARIKLFLGTLFEMDRGIYDVSPDGIDLSAQDLSTIESWPQRQHVELARRISRKKFWYKTQEDSEKLKVWLDTNLPYFTVENFMGLEKIADSEQLFKELLNTLGNKPQNHTFEQAMALLKEHHNPTIKQVAKELERAPDQSMKNEFMVVMSKQYQPFIMALFNTIKENGKEYYILNPIKANRYNQRDTLIKYWQEQQKLSSLTVVADNGDKVLDIKRIREKWIPMLEHAIKINDWGLPQNRAWFVKAMGNVLRASGINVTDEMMQDLFDNPRKWSNADSVAGLFAMDLSGQPIGLFSIFILNSAGQANIKANNDMEDALKLSQQNNPLYTQKTMLQGLARLVSKYTPVLYSSNHKNSEGKNVYDWGLNTKLSHDFRKLKEQFQEFVEEIDQVTIAKNNWLINSLLENPKQLEDIELSYFDGLKPTWGTRGTTRQSMSDREQLLTSILLYQNRGNGFNKNQKVNYMSLTHGDKTMTPVFRNMPRVDVGRYMFIPNTLIGRSDSALFNVFKSEYDRITLHGNVDFNNRQYDQGKHLFYFIPDFNYDAMSQLKEDGVLSEEEFNKIWPAGQRKLTAVIDEAEIAVINKILTRFVGNLVENTYNKWVENGIVKPNGSMFDKQYVQKLVLKNGIREVIRENRTVDDPPTKFIDSTGMELSTEEVNNIIGRNSAKDYAVNSFLFNVSLSQLFYGDPAESYKKAKGGTTVMDHVQSTMVEYTKRLAKDIAPRADLYWAADKQWYNTITLSDVETTEKYLAEIKTLKAAYVDSTTTSTDAQEITTVQEKLDVLYAAGKLTSNIYNEMSDVIRRAGPGGYYEFTNPAHLQIILQPDKPIYAGFRAPDRGARLTDYIKSSSYALYPPFTRDLELDKLRKMMENNNIARANFESAKKLGNPTQSLKVFNPDGTFIEQDIDVIESSIQKLNRSGFGIQQEVPYEEDKEAIKIITQMNEGIVEGISSLKDFNIPGQEEMTGKQVKKYKEMVRKKMLAYNLEKFNKSLNIDDVGNLDYDKTFSILAAEARKKGYTLNELQSVLVRTPQGMPIISTMFNTAADRFEGLLMSMVNKISEVKMPGKSYVQASGTGVRWNMDPKADLSNVIRIGNWDGSPLKTLRKEDGKVMPAQVILPFNFFDHLGNKLKVENFLIEENGKKLLDPERVPKELLQLIAARIPNQGHSSMLPVEIVGFTPTNMGDTVFIPAALVKQMGADFDVDKLYTYKRPYKYDAERAAFLPVQNYKERLGANNDEWLELKSATIGLLEKDKVESKNGRYPYKVFNTYLAQAVAVKYPDGNVPKHQVPLADEGIEHLQKEYFNIHWAILTHPKMVEKILKPLDKDDLKTESQLLKKASGGYYNFYDPMNQLEDFQRGKEAKRLVGTSSWAVKFNARIQDKKLQYGKAEYAQADEESKPALVFSPDFIRVMDEYNGVPKDLTMLSGNGTSEYSKKDGDRSNIEKRTKGDNHIMIQSESVDNMKYRTLDNLNLTPDTYKAVQALVELETENGWAASSKYWTRLLTQPIIWEYSALMKQGNDSLSTKYDADLHRTVRNKLVEKYRTEGPTEWDVEKIVFSPQLLLEAQTMTGDKFIVHQLAALNLFDKLYQIGDRMFQLESEFNQDVGGAGPNLFTALSKKRQLPVKHKGDFNSLPILNEYQLYENDENVLTEVGSTFEATIGTAINTVSQVFPYHALMPVLESIQVYTGRQQLTVDQQRGILHGFRSYVYTKGTFWWRDAQAERVRLLYGNDSLAKRMADAQKTWGATNPFLARLKSNIGNNTFDPSYIEYVASTQASVVDKQNMTNGWLYMLMSDDETQRRLGEDLLKYAYLTGGVQDANSFVQFVPISYLAGTEFSTMLRGMEYQLKEEGEFTDNNFIVQYLQHNPDLALQVSAEQFGKLSPGREYPESFRVPNMNEPGSALFKNFFTENGEPLPFVSYRSKTDGKWILYVHNPVNEGFYYTRIDTLGNTYTDEYNGQAAQGLRSIFSQNRSLAEKIPANGLDSLLGLKNNSFALGNFNNKVSHFEQIGIKEGGFHEVKSALSSMQENKDLPEYLRLVSKHFLETIHENDIAVEAKEAINANLDLSLKFQTQDRTAGEVNFYNKMTLNPNMVHSKEDAAKVFLHELTHTRLQWLIAMTGNDSRIASLEFMPPIIKEFSTKNPLIVKLLSELESLRYEALTKFRNSMAEVDYQQIVKDVAEGTVKTDEHSLYYALHSLQEFVAHVTSDKEIAAVLNTMTTVKGETILSRVWAMFADILIAFGKAMGFKIKNNSILKAALVRTMQLIDFDTKSDLDITYMLTSPGAEGTVLTEAKAEEIQTLLKDTYNVESTAVNSGIDWKLITNQSKTKKVHSLQGQRGRILDKLYEQADSVADALNRTHDLKARSGLRTKYREIKESINQIHQEVDTMTIAKVGKAQLKWVDEVLRNPKPSTIDVSLAIQTATIWESLIDILYGSLKQVGEVADEFVEVQTEAQKRRIELINTKATNALTEIMEKDVKLTPLDFREKLEDIDNISANTLSLARAKPLLVQGTAVLGWKEANSRDEAIYRNSKRIEALDRKMKAAGLTADIMLQTSEDGESWGLVNRLSDKWYNKIVTDKSNLESVLNAISKSEHLAKDERNKRKYEAWNKHWKQLTKENVFVDARIFYDVKTGARRTGPEIDKAFEALVENVGNKDYAEELVRKGQQKYQDYLSEREAMSEYFDTTLVLSNNDKLIVEVKDEIMAEWLKYNSPIELLNRVESGKDIQYNSEGDTWLMMAPKKEYTEYYDERFQKILENPAMHEAYSEYKLILEEMLSYLPVEIQRKLPNNFFPIVPKDTAGWLTSAFSKIRNWDAEMLNALTATDAEAAARLRPNKIPVMYTYPTAVTKEAENRSTDPARVLELFSMMALQHKHMGNVLDTINVAESVLKEVNRQRLSGEAEGKSLQNVIAAVKYFKDALVFRKPKELEGKVESPIYSFNPAKQHKIAEEIKALTKEKEELTEAISEKMIEGDFETQTEDKRIEAIDKKLSEYELMGRNIYGSKFADGLISINQMKGIAFNPFSAVSNYTFAEISLSINARGRVDYDPKTLREAMGVMSHAMKRYWTFGSAGDSTSSKIHGLMARTGIMSDVVDTDYGTGPNKKKTRTGKVLDPYNWQRSGDYFTKGKLMVAMMKYHTIEVTDQQTSEVKKIPLWEAFNTDGEWDVEKYGENNDWDTRTGGAKFIQFRDRMRKVSMMTFGSQDKNAPIMAKKNWIWRLAGQFRLSWFPEGIATRFKPQYFDANLGRDVKGRWRTYSDLGFLTSGMVVCRQMINALPGVSKDPFDGVTDRKGKLLSESPVDMENMRKNFAGLAWTTMFTASILILRSLGDDDKDKNSKTRRQLLINMLIRNQQDLLLYSSPAVFNTISGNFLPASQVLVDYFNAMKATAHYLFGDTSKDRDAFESWLKKMTRAGLPHPTATMYNKFETMLHRDLDKINR